MDATLKDKNLDQPDTDFLQTPYQSEFEPTPKIKPQNVPIPKERRKFTKPDNNNLQQSSALEISPEEDNDSLSELSSSSSTTLDLQKPKPVVDRGLDIQIDIGTDNMERHAHNRQERQEPVLIEDTNYSTDETVRGASPSAGGRQHNANATTTSNRNKDGNAVDIKMHLDGHVRKSPPNPKARASKSVENSHKIVKRKKRSKKTEIKVRYANNPPVKSEKSKSSPAIKQRSGVKDLVNSNWNNCYDPIEEHCRSEVSSRTNSRRTNASDCSKANTSVYCPEPFHCNSNDERNSCDLIRRNCIADLQQRLHNCIPDNNPRPPQSQLQQKKSSLHITVMNRDRRRLSSAARHSVPGKNLDHVRNDSKYPYDDGIEADLEDDESSEKMKRRPTFGQKHERPGMHKERELPYIPNDPNNPIRRPAEQVFHAPFVQSAQGVSTATRMKAELKNPNPPNTTDNGQSTRAQQPETGTAPSALEQEELPGELPSPKQTNPFLPADPFLGFKKPEPFYEIRKPQPRGEGIKRQNHSAPQLNTREVVFDRRLEYPPNDYSVPAARLAEHTYPFVGISPSGNLKVNPREVHFEDNRTAVLVHGNPNINVKHERNYDPYYEPQNYPQQQQKPPLPPIPQETSQSQSNRYESNLLRKETKGSKDLMEDIHTCLKKAIDADTVVFVGDQEFRCHHLALQVYSSYFKKQQRPREKMMEIHLPEDAINPKIFINLMDWILIGEASKKLVISKENVVGLFSAATYLGIQALKQDCFNFIKLKVESEDPVILKMYEEASENPHCKELLGLVSTKLAKLFPKLHKSNQFLQMNIQELCLLLDSELLNIKSEMEVCDAAIRWLLYDWVNRKQYTVEVMNTVRFGYLTTVELTQIQFNTKEDVLPNYDQIFAIPQVKVMVENGLKYSVWKEKYKTRPGELNKWLAASGIADVKPRHNLANALGDPNRSFPNASYEDDEESLKGGQKDGKSKLDEKKSQKQRKNSEGKWTDLITASAKIRSAIVIQAAVRGWLARREANKLRTAVSTIQAAFRLHRARLQVRKDRRRGDRFALLRTPILEGFHVKKLTLRESDSLIIIGGNDPTKEPGEYNTGSEIYQLHPLNNIWSRMGQIPEPRVHGGAALYRGHIIFFGGADPRYKTSRDKSVPCGTTWSISTHGGYWRQLADMIIPRVNFSYVLSQGRIWVFGGVDIQGNALAACEMYNPEQNVWTQISSMDGPRLGSTVAKFSNKIWIAGGLTKNPKIPMLKSVIVYDVTRDSFSPAPALPFARAFGTMTTFYTKIFLFAGAGRYGNRRSHSLNDVLVFDKGHWESVAQLATARHGHCQLKLGKYMLLLGGVNSQHQEPLNTCEVFNMLKYTVSTKIAPLPKRLVGCCGIVIHP